jgi:hypothetical protein
MSAFAAFRTVDVLPRVTEPVGDSERRKRNTGRPAGGTNKVDHHGQNRHAISPIENIHKTHTNSIAQFRNSVVSSCAEGRGDARPLALGDPAPSPPPLACRAVHQDRNVLLTVPNGRDADHDAATIAVAEHEDPPTVTGAEGFTTGVRAVGKDCPDAAQCS